ncbi:hypothetical protein ACEPAI_1439 [Sanghuangporus weigelae]
MFQYVTDNYENWTKLGKATSLQSVTGKGELDRRLVHLVLVVQGRTTFQIGEALHDCVHLREVTVLAIWRKLMDYRFIWVHGTPGSGKSTLALLLDHHARKTIPEAKVIKLRGWDRQVNQSWETYLYGANSDAARRTIIIIMDEAQSSYSDEDLWFGFFKNLGNYQGLYAIGFASYESELSCLDSFGTPFYIPARQKIILQHIDHNDGNGVAGLLFTRKEFFDMLHQWYQDGTHAIDDALLDVLFEVTRGHIGAIIDFLQMIFKDESYRCLSEGDLYTWHMFQNQFMQFRGQFIQVFLENSSAFKKGLPSDRMLRDSDNYDALCAVVQNGKVLSSHASEPLNMRLVECVRRGWLHSDKTESDEDVFFFASHLHQQFLEWQLFADRDPAAPLPERLLDYILKVIRLFNPEVVSGSRPIRAGVAQRQPEIQYQDEFYRCAHEFSRGSLLHSEFGNPDGRIDFHVNSKRWGIEIVRDADRLAQHSEWFSASGAYERDLLFDDYVVLYFRATMPSAPRPRFKNLYHLVFKSEYRGMKVLDNELKIIDEFPFVKSILS